MLDVSFVHVTTSLETERQREVSFAREADVEFDSLGPHHPDGVMRENIEKKSMMLLAMIAVVPQVVKRIFRTRLVVLRTLDIALCYTL